MRRRVERVEMAGAQDWLESFAVDRQFPRQRLLLFAVGLASLFATAIVTAVDYGDARSRTVKACEAISPSDSQGGLYFNPDGYRSYYVRSKCFQEAAILFRDATLCDHVKERRSLLASSWGYTAARCRQLVTEGFSPQSGWPTCFYRN